MTVACRTIILAHSMARNTAIDCIIRAPDGYRVEISAPKRSDPANRLLHALIGRIAQAKEWAGAKRDPETWKRLLVASWCRTRGVSVEVLPALDGHGVDIVPARTAGLSVAETNDLIEYIQCYAAENGIEVGVDNDGCVVDTV